MGKRMIFGLEPDQLDEILSAFTDGLDESEPDKAESSLLQDKKQPDKSRFAGTTASLQESTELAGSQIGPYKLLYVLGEGGMGVVYLADQMRPIRRQVALKIIKPGMDSARIIARFEAERQALALLEHPNIAHVFNAGTTDASRPYFVMEYVKGIPITEHCDRQKLSIEERLDLFLNVCEAIQHAHQKGIIHRDIKPSNILVSIEGENTIPKIIDFGVAKAISQPLTERTLYTEQGQLLGTPEYMSPEQAEMTNQDIDTRSDIYSLGVMLYVLLSGILPYDPKVLRESGIDGIRKVIREQDPKTPSTRLSTVSGEELTKLAQMRRTDVRTLGRKLHGDLDWITLKAMEKDRTRRYETAHALALDIQRHLSHQPVIAGPPSTVYQIQKFVRRNQTLVIGVSTVLAVLIAGIVVSTLFAIGQSRARFEAQLALEALTKLESDVEIDRNLSSAQKLHAEGRYQAALTEIDGILDYNDIEPKAHLLRATLLYEIGDFNNAIPELEKLLNQQPEIAGTAHYLLAEIHMGRDSNIANKHRRIAESLLPQTAEAYCLRAMPASTPEEKIQWLSDALEIDPSHYPSRKARALAYYALKNYQKMERDVEAIIILRPKDSIGYTFRAIARQEMGQLDEAVRDLDHAIKICDNESEMAELYDQCWRIHYEKGDYEQALSDARHCVHLRPGEIRYRFHVFAALVTLGSYAEAELEYAKIVEVGPEVTRQFDDWTSKHVFNMLATDRPLQLPGDAAGNAAFWRMHEVADYYRRLDTKADRFVPAGITQCWSPDGTKLAYSRRSEFLKFQPTYRKMTAVQSILPKLRGIEALDPSSNGIEILDLKSGTTRLLTSFGHSPRWSPEGKYIAFTRSSAILDHTDDEVWLISTTGGGVRRLAKGWAITWTSDAKGLYYHCRDDSYIYKVSVDDPVAEPERIILCRNPYPAISPDERYLAHVERGDLRIVELSSGVHIAYWQVPFTHAYNVVVEWSPDGRELSIGDIRMENLGLWIYELTTQKASKILDGPVARAIWSPEGTRIAFEVREPYCEIWIADLKPGIPTAEALGPGQTPDEHYRFLSSQYIRAAEAGVLAMDPASFIAGLTSLGIEEYSEGKYEQALERLTMVNALRRAVGSEAFISEIAFLAMALHRLGRNQEAKAAFEQFQHMLEADLDTSADFVLATATNVGPQINGSEDTQESSITHDGLSLYFASMRPGGHGSWDIWVATRETLDEQWNTPVNLGSNVNGPEGEVEPSISGDGLELYFRPWPGRDLMVATRETKHAPWDPVRVLTPPVNSSYFECTPSVSDDGLSLYFASKRPGGYGQLDIWVATRKTKHHPWREPVNLGATVNSAETDACPSISADDLTLYFTSKRRGGCGHLDTWVTRRATKDADWGEPVNLGPTVNSPHWDNGPTISADGMSLYFDSARAGGFGEDDIWQVTRMSLSDVNGNMKLDVEDLCILVEGRTVTVK